MKYKKMGGRREKGKWNKINQCFNYALFRPFFLHMTRDRKSIFFACPAVLKANDIIKFVLSNKLA